MGPRQVVVVGAGFTGLMAARRLQASGMPVRVVDKASRPGGRLSSRRLVDTGVKSFHVRDADVLRSLRDLATFTVTDADDGWRVSWDASAQAVAMELAGDLRIDHALVTQLSVGPQDLQVGVWGAASGIPASHVLLTMPTAQARLLLQRSQLDEPRVLREVAHEPRLVLLAALNGKPRLAPGGEVFESVTLTDQGDDQWQLVAQVFADQSMARWDDDATHTLSALLIEAARMVHGAVITDADCKRWRYAFAARVHALSTYVELDGPPVMIGGDGFGSPIGPNSSVERACRSGLDMAARILGM